MKKNYILIFFLVCVKSFGQTIDSNFVTPANKEALINKLIQLPCGISPIDKPKTMFLKIEKYLLAYQPMSQYEDDKYARATNLQAIKSIKLGGYGIGAVIYDKNTKKIISAAHNAQLTQLRSDLHGEMAVLNKFEDNPSNKKYREKYTVKGDVALFSSAEPCPMCFIRIATVGIDTKYCTAGPDDGMTQRIQCLPPYWKELALKQKTEKANSSPVMQMIAHVLFYSYMLDGRHA